MLKPYLYLAILFLVSFASARLLLSINDMASNEQTPDSPCCSVPSGASLSNKSFPFQLTEGEWRSKLSPEQYRVMREHGTERPFDNAYWNLKEPGIFICPGSGMPLFSSEAKYDSGTGWPSFFEPLRADLIGTTEDRSHGMTRTEVHSACCGSHLGHVFPDGPPPTGMRYCINSAALRFVPLAEDESLSSLAERLEKEARAAIPTG